MIERKEQIRYTYICDTCEYRGASSRTPEQAAYWERMHQCGVHREAYNSAGGYRGILGGYNRDCICGAHYITETPTKAFKCPREKS